MDVSQQHCDYHPSRAAVDKCQRCHRLICLSDKMTINTSQSSGFGDNLHYYNIQYVLCPICKYETNELFHKT